jgi:hypothetical protein
LKTETISQTQDQTQVERLESQDEKEEGEKDVDLLRSKCLKYVSEKDVNVIDK